MPAKYQHAPQHTMLKFPASPGSPNVLDYIIMYSIIMQAAMSGLRLDNTPAAKASFGSAQGSSDNVPNEVGQLCAAGLHS